MLFVQAAKLLQEGLSDWLMLPIMSEHTLSVHAVKTLHACIRTGLQPDLCAPGRRRPHCGLERARLLRHLLRCATNDLRLPLPSSVASLHALKILLKVAEMLLHACIPAYEHVAQPC
jgi:hypothetical protein